PARHNPALFNVLQRIWTPVGRAVWPQLRLTGCVTIREARRPRQVTAERIIAPLTCVDWRSAALNDALVVYHSPPSTKQASSYLQDNPALRDRAGLVETREGAKGGIRHTRAYEEITLTGWTPGA